MLTLVGRWDETESLQGSRDPRAARAIAQGLERAWRPQAPPRTPPRHRRPRWPPAALRAALPRALRSTLLSAGVLASAAVALALPCTCAGQAHTSTVCRVAVHCSTGKVQSSAAPQATKLAEQKREPTPQRSLAGRTCICRPVQQRAEEGQPARGCLPAVPSTVTGSPRRRAAAADIAPADTGAHLGSTCSAPASTLPLRAFVPALEFIGALERRPLSAGQARARRSCPKSSHVGAAMTGPPQAARPAHVRLVAERRCTGRTMQQACRSVLVLVGHGTTEAECAQCW